MMRLLVGTVVRQDPDVFRAHLRCLQAQDVDARLDFLYVVDTEGEHAAEVAELAAQAGAEVWHTAERPQGAHYAVTAETHHWSEPTFHFLAREKQRILDHAAREDYDGVFLVDSDLLCGMDTLRSLVASEKDIVSALFWTRWTPEDIPMPQVWMVHPYGFEGAGHTTASFFAQLRQRALMRVRGLGACTLIRREALTRGAAFWPRLPGLPQDGMWQGEDRHFCLRAERAHIELWVDAWPEVWHCYRPEQRAELEAQTARLLAPLGGAPLPGDWVSLRLEVLDVPQLARHQQAVRGRLGALPVLPEVEDAVARLHPGGSAFVEVTYPADWPVRGGEQGMLRVTLLALRSP